MSQDRSEEHVQSRVECGCGFNATGYDEGHLRDMLDEHLCAVRGYRVSWAEAIFSSEGYMILVGLALIAAVIFGSRS